MTPGLWRSLGDQAPVWPGRNWPLGATWTAEATNFAVYAPDATEVWLCVFDDQDDSGGERRFPLTEHSLGIWHGEAKPFDKENVVSFDILLDKPKQAHRFLVDDVRAVRAEKFELAEAESDPFFQSLKPPFGRGINSIQLFHDGDRWWVVSVLWDNERPGNPLPE